MKIRGLDLTTLAAAVLLAGTGQAFAAKTLVYCSEGSPEGFNPQFFTTGTTLDASSVPMYNKLVEFDLGTTNVVAGLAESWTAAPDGLSYTFKLRRGVKFHANSKFTPTRDFNADDVLFSYNRMADPAHPFHKTSPGQTFAYFDDMDMKNIVDRLEKVDPTTVRFVLKKPEAPFMANLAIDFASVLSAEYADKMKAAGTPEVIDREPIGTGPFQFVSYQKDAVIRYKAFDAHWSGRPKIDNEQHHAVAPRRREHGLRLGQAERQRLLAQHVFAGARRLHRPGRMQAVRQRQVDGVDLRVVEQVFVACMVALDPVLRRERRRLRAAARHRDDAQRRAGRHIANELARDVGGAQDADAKRWSRRCADIHGRTFHAGYFEMAQALRLVDSNLDSYQPSRKSPL